MLLLLLLLGVASVTSTYADTSSSLLSRLLLGLPKPSIVASTDSGSCTSLWRLAIARSIVAAAALLLGLLLVVGSLAAEALVIVGVWILLVLTLLALLTLLPLLRGGKALGRGVEGEVAGVGIHARRGGCCGGRMKVAKDEGPKR